MNDAIALNFQKVTERLGALHGVVLDPAPARGKYPAWSLHCPVPSHGRGRGDVNASAEIREGANGRCYYQCFANCTEEQFAQSLGTTLDDLRLRARKKPRTGCTLESLAEAKKLPLDFLRKHHLHDGGFRGERWVNIPYLDEAGNEIAMQRRLAIEKGDEGDERFKFKAGAKVALYGLNLLHHARKLKSVVLVEGASDALTLWFHGFTALGVPGANNWKPEWAKHLDGVPTVYLVVERDTAGEGLLQRVGKTKGILDRLRVIRPDGSWKDPSDLHCQDPDAFKSKWAEVLAAARPYTEELDEERKARLSDALKRCGDLLAQPDILTLFADDLQRGGVIGESSTAKLVYLSVTSRLLPDRPVSIALKGPSSAGKSFLMQKTLDHFPASAYYDLTAMSEKALAYSEEPLEHRFLVVYEYGGVQGETRAYLVRSLLSEGRLKYETVEKTKDGLRVRLIEREGPTGLLLSTTAVRVDRELETRLISATVSDSKEQTRAVMLQLAKGRQAVPDLDRWHALQEALECLNHRVDIPFATTLAEMIPPEAVRLRRDFGAVLGLIAAHAILHQTTRSTDGTGAIVATPADYRAVHDLVAGMIAEGVEATIPETVRETVRAVTELQAGKDGTVSVKALAGRLKLDRESAWRRAKSALEGGWLVNEGQDRKPFKLAPGAPLPDDIDVLPKPWALEDAVEYAAASAEVAS